MHKRKLIDHIHILKNDHHDYDPLLKLTKSANYALIGGSSHGTEEFYRIRVEITKRLIIEQGFKTIAIEGDWPDSYLINRYVRGDNTITDSTKALDGFKRFPTWIWKNKVMVEFIEWLHDYNATLPLHNQIRVYGLDLYNLNASIELVIQYLEQEDWEAAERAKQRYACFSRFKDNLKSYAFAIMLGIQSCQKQVMAQLIELLRYSYKYLALDGWAGERFFNALQNARAIKSAEHYYRSINSKILLWNIRNGYMADTIFNITKYLNNLFASKAKLIIWAHNVHIGDARATEFSKYGQINMGQLLKEKYNNKVVSIGFLTYSGSVTAASGWGLKTEYKFIFPALNNSYEHIFHQLSVPNFFIIFKKNKPIKKFLPVPLLERAIGIIYTPHRDRTNNYLYGNLTEQFDACIYLDKTNALIPMENIISTHDGNVYDTEPFGL